MDKAEAAAFLGVSRRQVDNILRGYQEKGLHSVVHGNTGRTPKHKTPPETLAKVLELAGEGGRYAGLAVSHFQELLQEAEGIRIGRSTLDRLLREHGVLKPRRKRPRVYRKRQRSRAEGMLVQIDASIHDWLEGRGPRLALVGAIDDATGKVLFLEFRQTEDQLGYLRLFHHLALAYGLPLAFYHDRHTILHSPKEPTLEDELAGRQPRSALQRVLEGLGVESIPASSPQAKGRIERLWGTLQQRLTRELRLQGIRTLADANAFLPAFLERHNARFAKEPADPEPAWVSLPKDLDVTYYFSTQEPRSVRADHTISYGGKTLHIYRGRGELSLAGKRVSVHRDPEGALHLYHGKQPLRHGDAAQEPLPRVPVTPRRRRQPAPPKLKTPRKATARQRAWLFGHA